MIGLAMSLTLLGLGLDLGGATTSPAEASPLECVLNVGLLCGGAASPKTPHPTPTAQLTSAAEPTARASTAPVSAARTAPPAPSRVIYRTRTVRVLVPAAPVQTPSVPRVPLGPQFVADVSRTPPLRTGLVGALGIVLFGLFVVVVAHRRRRRNTTAFETMTTDFLSNLSHELRTPLTPVKGYAEILERHPVSMEKARLYAGAILDASGRLERVIDTLVDVAEIDAGRKQVHRDALDLADVVGETLDGWRSREPGRTFRVVAGPAVAVADRALMGLAIDQLIDNAVKFSSADAEVHVDVREERGRVLLMVRDHGVGIAPSEHEEIFDDFRQVDPSATREHGGLGLGLALVRRVARMHDGDISVSSVPGVGSTFTLSLPAGAARDPRAVA